MKNKWNKRTPGYHALNPGLSRCASVLPREAPKPEAQRRTESGKEFPISAMKTKDEMKSIGALALALVMATNLALAQTPVGVIDQISGDNMLQTIKNLTTPEMGGRWIGTEENRQAAQYIADRFAAMGLEPAGDNGTYLQKLPSISPMTLQPYDPRKFKSVSFEITPTPSLPNFDPKTGVATGYVLRQPVLGLDYLVRHSSPSRSFTEKDLVVVDVINAAVDFEGKLLFMVPRPGAAIGDAGGELWRNASPWAFMAKLGAAGLIVENWTTPALQIMQLPDFFNSFATIDVTPEVGNALLAQGVKFNISLVKDETPFDNTAYNVLGAIKADPASPFKDETIVVGNHFDGQGNLPASEAYPAGVVFPGASDPLAGMAGAMEIARALKANNILPKRNILFAAFNGEENQFVGSRTFVNSLNRKQLDNIVAYIVFENGEEQPQENPTIWVNGLINSEKLFDLLAPKAAEYGAIVDHGKWWTRPSTLSVATDATPLSPGYVPNLSLWWNSWKEPDAWHTPRDTWEILSPYWMEKMGKIVGSLVLDLATRNERLVGGFLAQ